MHTKTINYTSWFIQNDIAEICFKNILDLIINEIKEVICMQSCVMKPGNCIFKYSYLVIIDYHSILCW